MANLEKICASQLNLRIISFFHEHPATVDTSRGIATWLNYDRKQIEQALDYLSSQNILISHRTGSTIAYAYTQDKKIVKKIKFFLLNKGGRKDV